MRFPTSKASKCADQFAMYVLRSSSLGSVWCRCLCCLSYPPVLLLFPPPLLISSPHPVLFVARASSYSRNDKIIHHTNKQTNKQSIQYLTQSRTANRVSPSFPSFQTQHNKPKTKKKGERVSIADFNLGKVTSWLIRCRPNRKGEFVRAYSPPTLPKGDSSCLSIPQTTSPTQVRKDPPNLISLLFPTHTHLKPHLPLALLPSSLLFTFYI